MTITVPLPPRARSDTDVATARRQMITDYRSTFGTDHGQRVLADLMQRGGVMLTSWRAGQPDVTAYLEGRRRLALEVLEMVNRDPEAKLPPPVEDGDPFA